MTTNTHIHYPTKFDKIEMFYEHQSLFNHSSQSRMTNRVRRPRSKHRQLLSPRERYLFQ